MPTKVCVKCNIEKDFGDFAAEKRHTDGKRSRCSDCEREYGRIWAKEHRILSEEREKCRVWRENNREKMRECCRSYRQRNKKKVRDAYREWKKNNIEKVRSDLREWHKDHPEKYSEYGKKRRGTLKGKLNLNISAAICNSLRGDKNGWHWEDLVGYTLGELKKHLEKQFIGGMSWDNYGLKGWTIDHRIPITAFNFETPFDIDFRQCWALRNLRPLWHKENMSKKDKLARPHQPSLLM